MGRNSKSRPHFDKSSDFTFFPGRNKWGCSVCWPATSEAEHFSMTAHAALRHEKSSGHAAKVKGQNVWDVNEDYDAWADTPPGLFDRKIGERMEFVDQLRDFIPFWRDTIEAAERGETLRFEDFLEKVRRKDAQRDGWGGWGLSGNAADWNSPVSQEHVTNGWESARKEKECSLHRSDDSSVSSGFVHMVAQLSPTVDRRRKERMRSFYKVSTQAKVERIQQLISDIQAASA